MREMEKKNHLYEQMEESKEKRKKIYANFKINLKILNFLKHHLFFA